MPASNVGQLQKNLSNGHVMLPREFLRRPRVNHSEEIVCPGSCAEHKHQPRALKVWHGFDALQEEAVFLELASQLGFHELLMSQGGHQHDNPFLVIWEHVVATPHDHGRSHLPARLEDVLATKVARNLAC